MHKKIFFIVLLFGFLLPVLSQAESALAPQDCDPSQWGEAGCGWEDFATLIKNIIDWLAKIVVPIAVFFIGWGGFMILTSGGNTERVSEGKKKVKIAIIGLIIVILAALIITEIYNKLGVVKVDGLKNL